MRAIFNGLLVLTLILGGWMAIPPSILFNPSQISIQGAQIKVWRTFPTKNILGMPYIRYSEIIRPIDGSTPCVDRQEFRYRDNGKPYATWGIEHWAARCLGIHEDYLYSVAWSPRLFGIIPLRPIEIDAYVSYETRNSGTIYHR